MSSHYRPMLVSPSYALFVLAFSHMVYAENTEQGNLAQVNSAAAKAAVSAARDLIELMADRLELSEVIARHRWNEGHRSEDDKMDAMLTEANIAAIKESGLEQAWTESLLKSQMLAAKEFQRQLFASWKSSGVYAFDDVPDPTSVVRVLLDKNIQEQMKKLQELKGVLCSTAMIAHLSETASVVFARRKIERQLLKPILESFDVHAREEAGTCPTASPGIASMPNAAPLQHVASPNPN